MGRRPTHSRAGRARQTLGDSMTRTKRALVALACAALVATPGATSATGEPTAPLTKRHHRSFCQRHRCIPYFWNGHGSIVQCRDRMWSHSGGRPGVCSGHGGLRHKAAAARHRSCGHFTAAGLRFHVTIERGHVSCHRARHVLRAFMSGKGHMHGPRNGPAAYRYWTIERWQCGHGAGGGGCIRGGKTYKTARDYILAVS